MNGKIVNMEPVLARYPHVHKWVTALEIIPESLSSYLEPHRFYHNLQHIEDMLCRIEKDCGWNLDPTRAIQDMTWAADAVASILFHDIFCSPLRDDSRNVELSADFVKTVFSGHNMKFNVEIVAEEIRKTDYNSTHNQTYCADSFLRRLDLWPLLYGSMSEFIKYDKAIFKEYQYVNYSVYKKKRIEILKKFGVSTDRLQYVESFEPKIGVMPGSFNPWHVGHQNILEKAEKIFDKVIIARGINTDKNTVLPETGLPDFLKYHQTDTYSGLLTEYINSLGYPVTVIRGLRNSTDLQSELNMFRFLQDLKPDINVISIFCDRHLEHISSSSVRQLKQFGADEFYLVK